MHADQHTLTRLRVLVVDDNAFTLALVTEILRGFGIVQILQAKDGEAAQSQTKAWQPDAIISDWNMEPITGLELVHWLRRAPDSPNTETPFILLTARNHIADIETARDSGVSEFVIKPITPDAVRQRLIAVTTAPREFIRSRGYVGPDRRRRTNIDYHGPMRRLSDPVDAATDGTADQAVKLLKKDLASVAALIRDLDVNDRAQIRQVYDRSQETRDIALQSGDDLLVDASHSLVQYIEACGASGAMEGDVIHIHIAAMQKLMSFKQSYDPARSELVKGLALVVERRMAAAQ
ncbi:MAG: response regulator [Maricaulaceae bacterium]